VLWSKSVDIIEMPVLKQLPEFLKICFNFININTVLRFFWQNHIIRQHVRYYYHKSSVLFLFNHIVIAGTDPNTLFSDSYPHFIGCLRDIKYTNKDEKHVSVPIETLEGVQEGCIDKCTNNPCHHGGQCINTYSETICDCFSTDYQGPYCSELGIYIMFHLNVFDATFPRISQSQLSYGVK
jgi:hypothetical protein